MKILRNFELVRASAVKVGIFGIARKIINQMSMKNISQKSDAEGWSLMAQ